jgi:hypothetical protein
LPVLTSPRGSKKATFESFDTALNDLNTSATDSELDFPSVETDNPPLLVAADEELAAAGLKKPDQAFR